MKDVADAEAVFLANFLNSSESLGQLRARNHPVENVIAGCQSAKGAKGILATLPQEIALLGIFRYANLAGAVRPRDFFNRRDLAFDRFSQSFQLNQENRGTVAREAGV